MMGVPQSWEQALALESQVKSLLLTATPQFDAARFADVLVTLQIFPAYSPVAFHRPGSISWTYTSMRSPWTDTCRFMNRSHLRRI
ncbi:hypothetical protein ASE82_10915 [Sphingomonas sp. Leaf230]|nr:hypothetical protein ASE82_10915 [Sphingomonas sp. Leaf230]